MSRRANDKAITECLSWLRGETPGEPAKYLFAVAYLAGTERKLRAAAKAVLAASEGTDESAMDEALDQLKKALK